MKDGKTRATDLYNSLDEIDSMIAEAAEILRRPKPSAEDMKKVEQLKNIARTKIGNSNTRLEVLNKWDRIVAGFNSMEGAATPQKPTEKRRKTA